MASFRAALDEMDILLPDGFWLQVAAKLLRYPTTHHVPTVILTYQVLRKLAGQRGRVYLLGAEEAVVRRAAERIMERFPGTEIAGVCDGYFLENEEEAIIREINQVKPSLLLVGISSPKKELFMARNREKLSVPAVIGVGGLIDILGGKTPEGPNWLRSYGFMWLYRFVKEPRRLWRRYTITNFQFAWLVLKQGFNMNVRRSS
jgi:N-acetylglucosaminyldiphosphoundecaprenol N-acetyl-beta-D-mannosaminyltransferase